MEEVLKKVTYYVGKTIQKPTYPNISHCFILQSKPMSWEMFISVIGDRNISVPMAFKSNRSMVYNRHNSGSWYCIDQANVHIHVNERTVATLHPVWLSALYNCYERSLSGNEQIHSLFNSMVLEAAGYGIVVECHRSRHDFPLPVDIESPPSHIGWMSACQIVCIPDPTKVDDDGAVFVRNLQTGQIMKKTLATEVRPYRGLRLGAPISIRRYLYNGQPSWSVNLNITGLKAQSGGQYVIEVSNGIEHYTFNSPPIPKTLNSHMIDIGDDVSLEYILLGPSDYFRRQPKVGEKIQVRDNVSCCWVDVRVITSDDDYVIYEDWDQYAEYTNEQGQHFETNNQLVSIGKGTRKIWCPWLQDISSCDVRPYKCLDIGDAVEAPVLYPDFAMEYYEISESELRLPAWIVGINDDEYDIEFQPSVLACKWWPGRPEIPVDIIKKHDSCNVIENTYRSNKVSVKMDLVRPLVIGAHPVIGYISVNPFEDDII